MLSFESTVAEAYIGFTVSEESCPAQFHVVPPSVEVSQLRPMVLLTLDDAEHGRAVVDWIKE